jgi:hypothetical protein
MATRVRDHQRHRPIRVASLAAATVLSLAIPAVALADPRDVLIAGDIAAGTATSQEAATAAIVAAREGLVMTAGDNAYPNGSLLDFRVRYEPTWGRFRDRTRPTPGNHDYRTLGAPGYFAYFGWRAGPRTSEGTGRGYYAFKHGSWLVLALDSEACLRPEGCDRDTPQHRWLARTLASSGARCALAVWHRPPFSSGRHGNEPAVRPLLRLLYRHGVEILVNGHDHDYERFAPARPNGAVDARFGIRRFVVGTGGADLRPRRAAAVRHSRVFQAEVHGVLRLRLRWRRYAWDFLPTMSGAFEDRGSGSCHGRPSGR